MDAAEVEDERLETRRGRRRRQVFRAFSAPFKDGKRTFGLMWRL
jgi:hypothetical protein